MQITCTKCTTSYRIAEAAIGANGRSVHCVRCDHIWRVEPAAAPFVAGRIEPDEAAFRAELGKPDTATSPVVPAAEPPPPPPPVAGDTPSGPPLDDQMVAGAPISPAPEPPSPGPDVEATETPGQAALSDIPIPVEDAPPLVPAADDGIQSPRAPQIENQREDIETVAARRARATAKRRRGGFHIPLPVAIAAMLVACAALIGLRKDVVRHAPQLASMYASIGLPVNLRGLEFAEVKIGNEIHDGVPVLVIEGAVVNKVTMPVDVPRLRFALRNASGAELYSWTAQPGRPALEPGTRLPFRSRLASPPAESHDVQVRFFTLRDAVAGLH